MTNIEEIKSELKLAQRAWHINQRKRDAADEMLQALKCMDAYWTADLPEGPDGSRRALHGFGEVSEDTMQVWRTIRAAIAKAEGE